MSISCLPWLWHFLWLSCVTKFLSYFLSSHVSMPLDIRLRASIWRSISFESVLNPSCYHFLFVNIPLLHVGAGDTLSPLFWEQPITKNMYIFLFLLNSVQGLSVLCLIDLNLHVQICSLQPIWYLTCVGSTDNAYDTCTCTGWWFCAHGKSGIPLK